MHSEDKRSYSIEHWTASQYRGSAFARLGGTYNSRPQVSTLDPLSPG